MIDYKDWIERYEQLITQGETPQEAQQSIKQWHRGDNHGRCHDHLTKYMQLRTKAWEWQSKFLSHQQMINDKWA